MLWQKASGLFKSAVRSWALLMIEFYRVVMAPFLGGACRFEPSCSVYAREAFSQYSLGTALNLTIRRLLKCRPGGPFGWDPVPESNCCHRGHHEFAK